MRLQAPTKTDGELETEIRNELKERIQQKQNIADEETHDEFDVETPRKRIAFTEHNEIGSIGKWMDDKEKRRQFLLTSSLPKAKVSKF